MKEVVFEHYGPAEAVLLRDIAGSKVDRGQVKVSVRSAALNPLDNKIRSGSLRYVPGQRFPHRLGSDFAGVITEVSPEIVDLPVGSEIFGWVNPLQGGAYGEEICVARSSVAIKPPRLSFQQAACLSTAGTAALQALRDVGKLQAGQKLLVAGCTGGVGIFAVPIARSLGAHVVGLCSQSNSELALELGCHQVLDYRTHAPGSLKDCFEVILDLSGQSHFEDWKTCLAPGGIYVDPVPSPTSLAQSFLYNLFHRDHHGILMSKWRMEDAIWLSQFYQESEHAIPIAAEYPLARAGEAQARLEKGGIVGKIVVNVEHKDDPTK